MGIFDMFESFMNPQNGYKAAERPVNEANAKSEQYYRDAQGNLQPYSNNGMAQFQRLMEQANALNNPAELENKWASGYSESPYAKMLQQKASNSGLDAASSMGLMGSSAALNNIQQSSGDIMQSDRQNYMNDLMNKYMASIGIGQNLYGIGANAAGQMSNNAMNQGQNEINFGNNMAGLEYNRENAPGDMFGKLAGLAIPAGINYATGGLSGVAKGLQH
jgi:hypothetical protein